MVTVSHSIPDIGIVLVPISLIRIVFFVVVKFHKIKKKDIQAPRKGYQYI